MTWRCGIPKSMKLNTMSPALVYHGFYALQRGAHCYRWLTNEAKTAPDAPTVTELVSRKHSTLPARPLPR